MTIDYEELVKGYYDGLVNNLRNFTPGPAFLDTWVHDEDHAKSLYGIFEAAESEGLKELSVKVKSSLIESLDRDALKKDLSPMGEMSLESGETVDLITMRFKKG